MAETGQTFACDKSIRFHHCDPAGIVFYPQYFILFNELVEDWFNQALGITFADLHVEHRLGVPMGSIECRFLSPSRIGETLRLSLSVRRLGSSSMTLAVAGRANGEVRVEALLTVVLASLETRRSVPITGDLRQRIEAYVVAAA